MHRDLTQDRLKELFVYNLETGWFTNRFSRGRAGIGARAGSSTGHGYRRIIIDYEKHYEHHLAWLYVYGVYPDELDHEDRCRSHNWISNLREATHQQNCHNADRTPGESGLRGAYLNLRTSRWFSKIQIGHYTEWLGTFDTAQEAHEAFLAAEERHRGEFALHFSETRV